MKFIILVISLVALVRCDQPTRQEKSSLLQCLNHHRVAAGNQGLAVWSERYESMTREIVETCQKSEPKSHDVSEHVITEQGANYLADSLNFWIEDGKQDERNGCVRFACNDYHVLISAYLKNIGCSYKHCPNLGGTFVACRYDFILA